MAHTRLFSRLRRALLLAREARRLGIPVAEHAQMREETWAINRRRFLELGAMSAAPVALAAAGCGGHSGGGGNDVAVVGGGIAGLTCAYRLMQAGVGVKVYDGQARAGGRMFSARGKFKDGQVCEIGGELIDTGHDALRNLATELGVALDDLFADTGALVRERYRIGGADVAPATVLADFGAVAPLIDGALATLTDPAAGVTWDAPNGGAALDAMSLAEWFDANAVSGNIRRILEIGYEAEFGLPVDACNAFNMLFLINTTPGSFEIYGDSDERFHTHLGNDSIPTAVALQLGGRVQLEHNLLRVKQSGSGFVLSFDTPSGTKEVRAGKVVLAIPFSALRNVDMSTVALSAAKKLAIGNLRYGNNAKLMVGYDTRVWRTLGNDGQAISDTRASECWEASRGQSGNSGIIVDYASNTLADELQYGTAEERAASFTADYEVLFPGVAAAANGLALRAHWPTVPWINGSYAAYQAGDLTTFSGAEALPEGNLHFAGEHTSIDYQGYMNGGCESGELAAAEVLADLGVAPAAIASTMTRGGFARHDLLEMIRTRTRRRAIRR